MPARMCVPLLADEMVPANLNPVALAFSAELCFTRSMCKEFFLLPLGLKLYLDPRKALREEDTEQAPNAQTPVESSGEKNLVLMPYNIKHVHLVWDLFAQAILDGLQKSRMPPLASDCIVEWAKLRVDVVMCEVDVQRRDKMHFSPPAVLWLWQRKLKRPSRRQSSFAV